jgi:hypothetical protein
MLFLAAFLGLLAWPLMASAAQPAQVWEVLNPAGIIKIEPIKMASRLKTLDGKTIGLRWNGKPDGDIFLDRIAELLSKQVPTAKIVKIYEIDRMTIGTSDLPYWKGAATTRGGKAAEMAKKIADNVKPDLVIASTGD